MGLLHSANQESHINYSPVDTLEDDELLDQTRSMAKASEINPRKIALREERIKRRIAEIGLSAAEELLGIVDQPSEVHRG